MIISVLGSGSKGNCTYITSTDNDGSDGLLIEAGLSLNQTKKRIEKKGLFIEKIGTTLITHRHTDHYKYANNLANEYDLAVLAPISVCTKILNEQTDIQETSAYDIDKSFLHSKKDIKLFSVETFKTHHDTEESIGFHITENETGKKLGYMTDTGKIPIGAKALLDCDIVLIESNYDEEMLINGNYPQHVKDRVRSDVGHLSNAQCATLVNRLDPEITKHVILMHVSEQNNSYDKICETFGEILDDNSPTIHIAGQEEGSSVFYI